jgi:hypothetical protein
MNPPPTDASRFRRYFCGASPALRILAWLSALCLILGWAILLLSYFGTSHPRSGDWFFGSHIVAFVAGISSACPLGGISAALVVLTLLLILTIGSAAAGA